MPRLKFDLKPEGPWRGDTVEAHNAELREQVAGWSWWSGGDPQPCDCGLYVEGMVCTCRPEERRNHTPEWVAKTLEARARRNHLDALKKKREFPPMERCSMGTCYWCRQPIVHGRAKQRSMHDGRKDEPDCRHEYHLRTRLEVQQGHLLRRDGPGCVCCGKVEGRWVLVWNCQEHRVAEYGFDGPNSRIMWSTGLEVDHFVALAVAWLAFPEPDRRRWFFGPRNLRMICVDCHKAKTQEDRLLLRQTALYGPEWLKAQVLRLLSDAGLLAIARPKGAT